MSEQDNRNDWEPTVTFRLSRLVTFANLVDTQPATEESVCRWLDRMGVTPITPQPAPADAVTEAAVRAAREEMHDLFRRAYWLLYNAGAYGPAGIDRQYTDRMYALGKRMSAFMDDYNRLLDAGASEVRS